MRTSLLSVLLLLSNAALTAQTRPIARVTLAAGMLPVGTLELSGTHPLSGHALARVSAGVYRRADLGDAAVAPCPSTCPPDPFMADQAIGAAVGAELYERDDATGFFLLGLLGAHSVLDDDLAGRRLLGSWQLGVGLAVPLGRTRLMLEARYVGFPALTSMDRGLFPLTVGLRF